MEKVLPQAAKLPWTTGFFKKNEFLENKKCAPGSEAAPDKWLLKKIEFLEKVLPQGAKLPRTSGFFKRIDFLENSSVPGSEAARDKWLLPKKV